MTKANHGRERILHREGRLVKAKVIAAGISMGDLAAEAGTSNPTVSNYVGGRYRGAAMQRRIWRAYRRLSGRRVRFPDFWGDLAARRPKGGRA